MSFWTNLLSRSSTWHCCPTIGHCVQPSCSMCDWQRNVLSLCAKLGCMPRFQVLNILLATSHLPWQECLSQLHTGDGWNGTICKLKFQLSLIIYKNINSSILNMRKARAFYGLGLPNTPDFCVFDCCNLTCQMDRFHKSIGFILLIHLGRAQRALLERKEL